MVHKNNNFSDKPNPILIIGFTAKARIELEHQLESVRPKDQAGQLPSTHPREEVKTSCGGSAGRCNRRLKMNSVQKWSQVKMRLNAGPPARHPLMGPRANAELQQYDEFCSESGGKPRSVYL